MKGQPRISAIYRMGKQSSPPDQDAVFSRIWRWCRDLWVDQGTIVAKPGELPEELRGPLVDWANGAYGKRKGQRACRK